MQYKITKPSKLLDHCGELIQKGYATAPILQYCREDVTKKLRLKEWDYYLIYNEAHAVALTLAMSNRILLITASLIDFTEDKVITENVFKILPKKILTMPESSKTGDIVYYDKNFHISFTHVGQERNLSLKIRNDTNKTEFEASILLFQEPKDSMVIATPFKQDNKAFYYNQKIIGMNALGTVRYQGKTYSFSPNHSFGLLDWGRGVWPYKTTWYWSAAQGTIYGNLFGFNLGYGFGDTSAATENMLFFNGVASKLEDIVFHIPRNERNEYDYLKPWAITSSDQRFEMEFVPILDRSANLSVILLSSNQHQVFGKFNGYAVLDDGTTIYVQDFLGFAERVQNRW